MSNQAKVTSLDALDSLRASLIIFLSKARRSLDDAGDELRRMRLWLQHDMRTRWENEARKCRRALEAAEQELFSAKLSSFQDNLNLQQTAVRKAKQALAHAEEKLRNVRNWSRNYEGAADPLAKRLEGLRQFLDLDLPKGIAYIVQMQRTLGDYADLSPPPEIDAAVSAGEDGGEARVEEDEGTEPSAPAPAP
jgi:hypothetical protein